MGYLCQVEVCLLQQVGVVHTHQPDHVIKLLVGLVHGDSLVVLTNAHIDPAEAAGGREGERDAWGGGEGGRERGRGRGMHGGGAHPYSTNVINEEARCVWAGTTAML